MRPTPIPRSWRARSRVALAHGLALTLLAACAGDRGEWDGPYDWPLVAAHLIHLPPAEGSTVGQVVLLPPDYEPGAIDTWLVPLSGDCLAQDFDPQAPNAACFQKKPNPENLFCAGHTSLADGTAFVAGGHRQNHLGLKVAYRFDPQKADPWTKLADMEHTRWYPTCTTLSDGRVLVTSGTNQICNFGVNYGLDCRLQKHEDGEGEEHHTSGCGDSVDCFGAECCHIHVDVPEIYDPKSNSWTSLDNAPLSTGFYPFTYLLPDGRILFAGSEEPGGDVDEREAYVLDLSAQSWEPVHLGSIRGGSSVMYEPGKVLRAGGNWFPATNAVEVIDMTDAEPEWELAASMNNARFRHNLTILADGSILATGGTRTGQEEDGYLPHNAVMAPELLDPDDPEEQWRELASMEHPRLYHSAAMLLPDGRVLSAGGDQMDLEENDGVRRYPTAEVFSPPYLFDGDEPADRPEIVSAPGAARYGDVFWVATPDAARIRAHKGVNLLRLAAVTHAFDENQRFVPLRFWPGHEGLLVEVPASANVAPPGYYMLFLVDEDGVPSVATYVRLDLTTVVWVDFAHQGDEEGTFTRPFDTLGEGIAAVSPGGVVRIKQGGSSETPEITKPMTIESWNGDAYVGI